MNRLEILPMALSRRSVAPLLLFSAVVVGCEAETRPAQWTSVTDTVSTGTVRVVHVPPISGGTPGFEIREELRIGSVDGSGPESFGDLKGLVVTDHGHIVVLDALAQDLRVFAPDGTHTATFGGKGCGAGEFESAYGLVRWIPGGDTTLVLETERPPVPIPTTVRDSAIATVRKQLLEKGTGAANQDWSKVAEEYPAVSSIFLAENGNLWVGIATTDDSAAQYDLYRPDGEYWRTVSTTLDVWPYVHPVVRGDQFLGHREG